MARRNTSGSMSVRDAGKLGGKRTAATHSHSFYVDIGRRGGKRVSELINRGKRAEGS